MVSAVTRKVIRCDGTAVDLPAPLRMSELQRLIAAEGLDTVSLRHLGRPLHVMLVDDTGLIDGKPVNPEATRLYHANCRPGTTQPICGDVVIVPDSDFA